MIISKKGFSLTELMVVIAVSGILMAVTIPTFIGARNRSDANACKANLEIINSAIKEWALDNPDVVSARAADVDANNRIVRDDDIDSYVEDGFASLEEPNGGSYLQTVGATNDVVAIIESSVTSDGSINKPVCSEGGTHVLD